MKTNREFIEGIYKKAELLRQQKENSKSESWHLRFLRFNREKKRVPAFAASLATFALFALVIITGSQAGKSPNIDNIENKHLRTVEGQNPIANVSAYGIDEDVSNENINTVLGVITEVVDIQNQKYINIQVSKLLCGEGTPDYITITEGLPLTITTESLKEMNVIVSVKPILGQEEYALIDENSIYFYAKEENNQNYYQAIDGTIVSEDSFK
ncbi:hypothetical protein [Lachnoclostridium phytofermentans]|uniref:Uncharacterized protein n=1 Tax=Lachnoclostridium phytofermentans (strain ATCC 700394 / DSM 18823 / ISDg) TaxID=357809 RepID=A9KRY6_LACP7|nr:hypothetical protein [Lachnoclostridium phytofermentans]ABX40617.1 hypothetical protein Cphy_0230 [Lachnoclostridium phytofermentans ISDg]